MLVVAALFVYLSVYIYTTTTTTTNEVTMMMMMTSHVESTGFAIFTTR